MRVTVDGRARLLDESRSLTIGRDSFCDIRLDDERVSRRHAVIRQHAGSWLFEDAASANGSFVDGRRVTIETLKRPMTFRLGNAYDGPQVSVEPIGLRRTRRSLLIAAAGAGTAALGAYLAIDPTARKSLADVFAEVVSPSATSTAAASATALSRADVAAVGTSATTYVEVSSGHGSGAYLGRDRVLTAAHVVEGTSRPRLYYSGRSIGTGTVIARDTFNDLALLTISGLAGIALGLEWGDTALLRVGDELVALGFPADLSLSVKAGVLSAIYREAGLELLQTDANINPGMSGGPVLDRAGRLVAISVATHARYPGLGFAVSAATARPFVERYR
jgi:S1-C subfamily serine protease